jgi:outer membrane protease
MTVLNREWTERKRDSDKELPHKLERSFNHNVKIRNAQKFLIRPQNGHSLSNMEQTIKSDKYGMS